ncbi:MAG: hypothetical protein ACYTE3_13255, partial [Planctomycetota bacterium]
HLACTHSNTPLFWDFPFDFTVVTPARHTVNSTTFGASISTHLAINSTHTPARKIPSQANPPKIQHFGTFSTHPDQ